MDEILIRPARVADGDVLAEIDRSTWSPESAVVPRPEPPYGPFFDMFNRPEQVLVAEEPDGGVLGWVRLVAPTPLPSNRHVRQIRGLAVAERARRRGVGRALLRAAAEETVRQGATRLTLRVLAPNEAARALYASEGFEVEGVLPGEFRLEGRYVDDVAMGRWVAPEGAASRPGHAF
ncbi:GNAT family N-acetyltransferase [Streptomyces sp. NPDC001941]|uniref:GNAT family N-acetyltransferase n=1 Tax=Streptomyces sp. NPDC001941 TaxID=3154659 RepID=UPI003330D2D9